jgi:uncharacterized SAM-binding protein YcdF (DUF218 family)
MCIFFCIWLIAKAVTLKISSSKRVDAFFVLGGSIQREVYVSKIASNYPQIPILISQGSPDGCIVNIFQREAIAMDNIWLEKCANSTFGNFYYAIPIFRRWGVRKVKLITSPTHLPRARWMAQILLGSHGIWVESDIVKEQGIPGNREYWLKTGIDVTRSLLWAGLSQFIYPQCSQITRLADVDMRVWESQGFRCEREATLNR